MWTISATAHTNASVGKVWAIYQDVAHWPVWDKGLVMYQPHGPFATGSQGLLQAVGGPGLRFELILVEDGHQFVDRTPIGPDAAIIGRHEQLGMASGTQITHTIEIHSPDAEGLALAIGFRQEELQETVTALARYAEENHDA